jgi:hypothetical protein
MSNRHIPSEYLPLKSVQDFRGYLFGTKRLTLIKNIGKHNDSKNKSYTTKNSTMMRIGTRGTTPYGLGRFKKRFAMSRLIIQKISNDHDVLLKT